MEDEHQPYAIHRAYFVTMPDGTVPQEDALIEHMTSVPRARWAIDHSLDGVHIFTDRNLTQQTIEYQLVAVLSSKEATFWKLKFNGS